MSGGDIAAEKKILRQSLMKLRSSVSEESRREYDAVILDKIICLEEYKEAFAVLTYASYNGEADTYGLIERTLQDGKRVACPVCELSTGEPLLDFYYITSVKDLVKGYKGIPEPDISRCEKVSREDIGRALIIVPIVGYDTEGNRLGYGKGFYDRFLAGHDHLQAVGIAYSCQRCDKLPVDEYDVRPDRIITENGI